MSNKKTENSSTKIDLNWFNKDNIDLVDDKVEEQLVSLLDIQKYMEISRKHSKLNLELTSSMTMEQKLLFYEYQKVDLEISSYHNSLAYHLGINDNSNNAKK